MSIRCVQSSDRFRGFQGLEKYGFLPHAPKKFRNLSATIHFFPVLHSATVFLDSSNNSFACHDRSVQASPPAHRRPARFDRPAGPRRSSAATGPALPRHHRPEGRCDQPEPADLPDQDVDSGQAGSADDAVPAMAARQPWPERAADPIGRTEIHRQRQAGRLGARPGACACLPPDRAGRGRHAGSGVPVPVAAGRRAGTHHDDQRDPRGAMAVGHAVSGRLQQPPHHGAAEPDLAGRLAVRQRARDGCAHRQ